MSDSAEITPPYSIPQFLALETQVWEALKTGDANADNRLLADNFLGVYSDGFATKSDHTSQLNRGPTIAHYTLSNTHVMTLAPNTVLFAYRADFQRLSTTTPDAMYITSIWQQTNNIWVNIFSQDTSAEK